MNSKRIALDPAVCNGKPAIKGTQTTVSDILGQVATGKSWDDILCCFPEIEPEDIPSALHYAISLLDNSEVAVS